MRSCALTPMDEFFAAADLLYNGALVAERFAALPVPWKHAVTVATFAQTPTLVVTGGWNDEYEQIAARVSAAGAEHLADIQQRVEGPPGGPGVANV